MRKNIDYYVNNLLYEFGKFISALARLDGGNKCKFVEERIDGDGIKIKYNPLGEDKPYWIIKVDIHEKNENAK